MNYNIRILILIYLKKNAKKNNCHHFCSKPWIMSFCIIVVVMFIAPFFFLATMSLNLVWRSLPPGVWARRLRDALGIRSKFVHKHTNTHTHTQQAQAVQHQRAAETWLTQFIQQSDSGCEATSDSVSLGGEKNKKKKTREKFKDKTHRAPNKNIQTRKENQRDREETGVVWSVSVPTYPPWSGRLLWFSPFLWPPPRPLPSVLPGCGPHLHRVLFVCPSVHPLLWQNYLICPLLFPPKEMRSTWPC